MITADKLMAPFPWFGGKSLVAPLVWDRFGDLPNYVEPFFGSGAVLLGRPGEPETETVNDKDGYVANFWRALQAAPESVAGYADNPVNENDLHARHSWLLNRKETLVASLEGDPDYYDAKIAGWWVWGIACWIGGGFCSGNGPWVVQEGQLVRGAQGVERKRPHLATKGKGVNRKLVHLGDAGRGVNRKLVHLGRSQGVNRQGLYDYFGALADRLRNVRVCCGDWERVCGPTPTFLHGLTGVFLDPPYSAEAGRDAEIYQVEDLTVAHRVREWAIANGDNPLMRIALCGYADEHVIPESWDSVSWKTQGGYGSQGEGSGRENSGRERIWFSPYCIGRAQPSLF